MTGICHSRPVAQSPVHLLVIPLAPLHKGLVPLDETGQIPHARVADVSLKVGHKVEELLLQSVLFS